jgi:ribosomal protein S18 acetylase RimI-like enzyme
MNEEKLAITLRPGSEEDLAALGALDHGYSTEYVWQMELDTAQPRTGAHFREMRLPRLMQVAYPRAKDGLASLAQRSLWLVAEAAGQPVGYAALSTQWAPGTAWLSDVVVAASQRRRSIGSRLVLAAQNWAREHGQQRLVLEMQAKNYPAIKMAQKLAFDFAGYNDRYYDNQDIALFFAKRLA